MMKVLVSYYIVFIIEETALFVCGDYCNLVSNLFAESAYIERCPSGHRPKTCLNRRYKTFLFI